VAASALAAAKTYAFSALMITRKRNMLASAVCAIAYVFPAPAVITDMLPTRTIAAILRTIIPILGSV
jgi:hypothetical protein